MKAVRLQMWPKKANVSISTVSHVLNHTRFVSEETRKKVMDAVEELGQYSPDASGRSFRTGKMMIGLVVPDITNSVFAALIEDVDDVISKQGYNLVISNTRDNLRMEKQALRSLASGVVDGIVIASTAEDFQTIKAAKCQISFHWYSWIECCRIEIMTVLFWIVGRQLPKCWKK